MTASTPASDHDFELRATLGGHPVVFGLFELWWSDAEPPEQDQPTFTLTTSADAPPDAPRFEAECPVPAGRTFRDLAGETFRLEPLATEGRSGWVQIDLGRGYRRAGHVGRDWVARTAEIRFVDAPPDELRGVVRAELERSVAKVTPGEVRSSTTVEFEGTFRTRAPRW